MKNIFITGAGGCVGHYLFDVLSPHPDYHLYLLVRNPAKLKFDPAAYPNVTIIEDDLMNIKNHADLMKEMDFVVHLAADWGSGIGNFEQTLDLFNLLDPAKHQKVIYLSTASLLDANNRPIEAVEKFGTPYIHSKYLFLKKLPELKIYPNVITLFPTWVLGGDSRHPFSHASEGILILRKWLWLIRFFTVDASFHYIHALDISRIIKYLLENEVREKEFVLGNEATTASRFIREICNYYKVPVYFQISIPLQIVELLSFLIGRKLRPWDLYCLNRRHFTHQVVNAETFGIESKLETVGQILKST